MRTLTAINILSHTAAVLLKLFYYCAQVVLRDTASAADGAQMGT
jgi:hypothetical protein